MHGEMLALSCQASSAWRFLHLCMTSSSRRAFLSAKPCIANYNAIDSHSRHLTQTGMSAPLGIKGTRYSLHCTCQEFRADSLAATGEWWSHDTGFSFGHGGLRLCHDNLTSSRNWSVLKQGRMSYSSLNNLKADLRKDTSFFPRSCTLQGYI